MLRKMLAAQQEKTTKEEKSRARERERGGGGGERDIVVRERRDYRRLVANAKTCTILQYQAHNAATCPTKTKINGADDCKLGLHPDPSHHDRVGLVPFGSEPAGEAFLSRVLPVENGIR